LFEVNGLSILLGSILADEVKDRLKVKPGILFGKQPHNLGSVAADGVLEQSEQVVTL